MDNCENEVLNKAAHESESENAAPDYSGTSAETVTVNAETSDNSETQDKQETAKAVICSKCGAQLQDGQAFCPMCGQKAGEQNGAAQGDNVQPASTAQKKFPVKVAIIGVAAAIAAVVLIAAIAGGRNRVDFQKLYDDYCSPTWAELGSDGSYLTLDSNPFDMESDVGRILYIKDVNNAIKEIHRELNLPSSLFEDMQHTRALDGRQKETFDNVEVSWSYHPDKGLVIIYKKAK